MHILLYFIFYSLYFLFILFYVYFPFVLYFSIFALSMERTRLSFHCWLYNLCIVVYVTNKTWNLKLVHCLSLDSRLCPSHWVADPATINPSPAWMNTWNGEEKDRVKQVIIFIQCPPLILAPLVNMSKGGCENKSALFILFIFHSKNSQNSNLSLK